MLAWSKQGATVESIEHQYLIDTRVPLPPLPEQRAIADFLDRETAKIDALVEEQRRLIALLAEKRQATISHAVTRGLNPNACLKPSGVDWLGDIPEGWEVVRLSALFDDVTEPGSADLPILSVSIHSGVSDDEISDEDMDRKVTRSEDRSKYVVVRPGDLTYNMMRAWQGGFGAVRVLGMVSPAYVVARPRNPGRNKTAFIELLLRTPNAVTEMKRHSRGVTDFRLRLYWDEFKTISVAIPSVAEQEAILSAISQELDKFDTLTETATSAITVLQERRSALISAAVTGKIDVREVAKAPAQVSQSLHVSAMVAGVIIARHGQHLGFGRMMVQKFLFMTQASANAPEIGGDYKRQAAGPLDRDLQSRVETDLEAAGLVRVRQEGGRGSRVQYEFLGDAAALHAELASALGDRMERFEYLSSQLGSLTKNGIEAVATLYAAWNDFLICSRTPDRTDIIREVLENWHPEKSRKFTAEELGTWLDWMERQNIVPDGTGLQTQTGRLFP